MKVGEKFKMEYRIVNGELYHYGVKGMKWGVRRAQKTQKKYADKAKRQADLHISNAKHIKRILDDNYDPVTESSLSSAERKSYQKEMASSINHAKTWMKSRDDIMKMSVTSLTSKNVKARYNETKRHAAYYPFAK